jgi:hypothetical protein
VKTLLAAVAACAALAAQAAALGAEDARHLLERAGFGASAADIAAYAPLDREAAVERLLGGGHGQASLL